MLSQKNTVSRILQDSHAWRVVFDKQQTQVRWRLRRDSKPTEPHYSGWDAKALITIEPYLLPFTAIAIKGDVGTAASAKQYAKI